MAKWKLYWVTDRYQEHLDDCFIIAENSRSAAEVHEFAEGMEPGDATAERVGEIPDEYEPAAIERFREWSRENAPDQADAPDLHPWPWYAYEEDLIAAGAEIRKFEAGRGIILGGREFFRSTMEAMLEAWEQSKKTWH